MVLPLNQKTMDYLANEGKNLGVHYVLGELIGRAVVWFKPGINMANLGLFAVTTYVALPIVAKITKTLSLPRRKDFVNHVLSLGVSYGVLKYIGYSVSPVGVLALGAVAVVAYGLSHRNSEGSGAFQQLQPRRI